MNTAIATVQVYVEDPDTSLPFYRDALGLAVRKDFVQDDVRWLTLGTDAQPEIELLLVPVRAAQPDQADALLTLVARGALTGINFRTDDLDAAYARADAAGAEIAQEITDQPWGEREFALRDPSGTIVRVAQAPGT